MSDHSVYSSKESVNFLKIKFLLVTEIKAYFEIFNYVGGMTQGLLFFKSFSK